MTDNTLAKRIFEARTDAGLTQSQLAEQSGLSQTMISKLEAGKSLETTGLIDIARVCNVNVEWLATGEGEKHGLPNDRSLSGYDAQLLKDWKRMPEDMQYHMRQLIIMGAEKDNETAQNASISTRIITTEKSDKPIKFSKRKKG